MFIETIRLSIAAGELISILSGNPSLPLVQNEPPHTEIQANFSDLVENLDADNTISTINTLVNKQSEPEYWETLENRLLKEPNDYFFIDKRTTRKELFYANLYDISYYPWDADESVNTYPSANVIIIEPDGIDYLDPMAMVVLQVAKDGTLSGYKTDLDLPGMGYFSKQQLEELGNTFFQIPEEMNKIPWSEAEEDPINTHFRNFRDPVTGNEYYQQVSSDGYLTFGFSKTPIAPTL